MNGSGALVTEFALLAALCWGFADFIWAKAAKNIGPALSIALAGVLEAPLVVIFYLLSNHHWIFNGTAFIFAAFAGLIFTVGGSLFFIGLEKGPVSLVSPLASMYPLITTIIAIVVFKSHLTSEELVGIIIIVIGIFLTSGIVTAKKEDLKLNYGVKLALITACLWGVAFSLLGQAISRIGWLNATLLEICFGTVCLPFLLPLIKRKEDVSVKNVSKNLRNTYVLLATIINLVGFFSLNFAISKSTSNDGAVAAAISACYPIITIVLALKHFKENIKPAAIIGVLLGISGIVLLALA